MTVRMSASFIAFFQSPSRESTRLANKGASLSLGLAPSSKVKLCSSNQTGLCIILRVRPAHVTDNVLQGFLPARLPVSILIFPLSVQRALSALHGLLGILDYVSYSHRNLSLFSLSMMVTVHCPPFS